MLLFNQNNNGKETDESNNFFFCYTCNENKFYKILRDLLNFHILA